MSAGEWQWHDGGSGPGHMQRVVSSGVSAKVQQAYSRSTDHAMKCVWCRTEETRCETAQGLLQAYRDGCEH